LIFRRTLFKRFNYVCQGCNIKCVHPNDNNYNDDNCATIDHIKPISKGGDHTYTNTQLLCRKCNRIKGANEKYFEHKQKAKQMELQFDLNMIKHCVGEQLALFK
jgi:5-methylcytosine-specific restriction endonuclease McrA